MSSYHAHSSEGGHLVTLESEDDAIDAVLSSGRPGRVEDDDGKIVWFSSTDSGEALG